jgi:heme exporter protein D
MLRGALLAFVGGWILWFWIDKSPANLGPLAYPQDGDFLYNFQVTIDLLKQARFSAAFIYVWKAHYLVLSLALGAIIGMVLGAVSRTLSRNRLLKLYLPQRKRQQKQEHAQQQTKD